MTCENISILFKGIIHSGILTILISSCTELQVSVLSSTQSRQETAISLPIVGILQSLQSTWSRTTVLMVISLHLYNKIDVTTVTSDKYMIIMLEFNIGQGLVSLSTQKGPSIDSNLPSCTPQHSSSMGLLGYKCLREYSNRLNHLLFSTCEIVTFTVNGA